MKKFAILDQFFWQIGVDLGSNNIRIYVKDKGIVVDEPMMMARVKKRRYVGLDAPRVKGGEAIAYGSRAKEMWSKEPKQIEVIKPIKNGIIADLEAVESLVGHYLRLVRDIPSKYPKLLKTKVLAGVPSGVTEVQKRAIRSVFREAGAGEVILVESAVLAAVGLGLTGNEGEGLFLIDIGGGKSEVNVVSMGGVVVGKGIKTAGDDFDNAITNYVRMKHGILIGPNTAERIKIEVSKKNSGQVVVRGRDLGTGLPKTIKVSENEVREAVNMEIMKIVRLVGEVLDETPPELVDDMVGRGMIMFGGGSQISDIRELLETQTKISVVMAENPEWCVTRGLGDLVARPERLEQIRLASEH